MATINGKDVFTYISTDGGTTYKKVVCETSGGISISSNANSTTTKCGVKTGVSTVTWELPIEGVVETAPAGTELSYEDLLSAINAGTALKMRLQDPDGVGTNFYHQGDCFLTSLELSLPADDLATFTGTLTGNSALDITP